MTNIVRLAASNEKPALRACTDCKHFHPNTSSHGVEGWELFGFGPGVKPTADAMRFGTCSAFGGGYASIERKMFCNGAKWEKSE